jgi:hypothetical protein
MPLKALGAVLLVAVLGAVKDVLVLLFALMAPLKGGPRVLRLPAFFVSPVTTGGKSQCQTVLLPRSSSRRIIVHFLVDTVDARIGEV